MNLKNKFVQNYHLITILKKTLFIIIIFAGDTNSSYQLIMLIVVSSLFSLLLILVAPYNSKATLLIKILIELLYVICLSIMLSLE